VGAARLRRRRPRHDAVRVRARREPDVVGEHARPRARLPCPPCREQSKACLAPS
jgi:hypothetical protein